MNFRFFDDLVNSAPGPKNLGLGNGNIKQKIIQQKLLKFVFGKFTLNVNSF